MQQAPQVSFASQAPSPRVAQYPAPYSPYTEEGTGTDMAGMIGAIMPIFMIMMLMLMMKPRMSGRSGK